MFDLGKVRIEPAGRFEQLVLLNEWTTFSRTGRYLLEARVTTPVRVGAGEIQPSVSRVTFDVTERDEVRLHQLSEQLLTQIEGSRSVREAREAASLLAEIRDPLIVPYLERALASKKYIEVIAVDGLARVGHSAAVRTLAAIANESPNWPPDPNTTVGHRSFLANQALMRVAETASNREVRRQAQGAIRMAN